MKCVYCGDSTECLFENKKYCETCASQMHKECIRCHLPYHKPEYFSLDDSRCNKCQKAYLTEKMKRKHDLSSSDSEITPKNIPKTKASLKKKPTKKMQIKKNPKHKIKSEGECSDTELNHYILPQYSCVIQNDHGDKKNNNPRPKIKKQKLKSKCISDVKEYSEEKSSIDSPPKTVSTKTDTTSEDSDSDSKNKPSPKNSKNKTKANRKHLRLDLNKCKSIEIIGCM